MAARAWRSLPVAGALLLAGCTVGPSFQAPDPDTPAHFHAPSRPGAQAALSLPTEYAEPDPRWWHSFHDKTLDALIERAIAGNLSLRQAVLRIAEARAQVQTARAAGLPNVRAAASYKREQLGLEGLLKSQGAFDRLDALGAPGSPLDRFGGPGAGAATANALRPVLDQLTAPINLFQLGFDASWELDFFGRVRRGVEAADARTRAVVENRNDALVSLEAEVAQTYAQLRGAQALQRLAEDQIALARESVALTQSRRRTGLGSELDVQTAVAQLTSLEAQPPQYDQQVQQAMNALALLAGEAPGTLDAELATPVALPLPPLSVPVGLPATLARRRPDVRAAEAALHAATAEIGVSVAQLFPDISLTGQFGFRSTSGTQLTNWANHFYSFGPSISLPIFQGGTLRTNVLLAKTRQSEAALAYRQAVLTALNDVENALVAYRSDQTRHEATARTVEANRHAFALATDSYRHGIVSFLDVLDAQRQLNQSEQQLAQAALQQTTDRVALYKALGGGWQDDATSATAPPVGTPGNGGVGTPSNGGVGTPD